MAAEHSSHLVRRRQDRFSGWLGAFRGSAQRNEELLEASRAERDEHSRVVGADDVRMRDAPRSEAEVARAEVDPLVAYRINDCQMAQALVAAGEGIALLPRIMLRAANPAVAIRPLASDPPMRRIAAVRLATRYLAPATERFVALLCEASTSYAEAPSQ